MAKKTIPENYKATCLPTFLTPPLHQSIDEEGNFVYTESSIKKGLQLRNTEVIETWQATNVRSLLSFHVQSCSFTY